MPTSVLLLMAERHSAALTVVDTVLDDLNTEQPSLGLPFYLGLRPELSFGTGDWPAASSSALEALRLAEEQGSPAMVAYAAACLTRLGAGRGDEQACRSYAKLVRAAAPAGGDGLVVQASRRSSSCCSAPAGRPRPAAVASEPGRPPSLRLNADVVEALVRAGRREVAERTRMPGRRQRCGGAEAS